MTLNELFGLGVNSYITIDGKLYKYSATRRCFNMLYFIFVDLNKNKIIISFNGYDTNEFHSICYNETLTTYCLDFVIPASEKEVLEIQLKDAEEQLQKDTARVDSIKAKIEELSKPKLKIGGLYKFEKFGNDFIGFVTGIDRNDGWYEILRSTLTHTMTNTNGYKVTEITNPKYSHIGKTLLEFSQLRFGNF
jgi:hypothetical protein